MVQLHMALLYLVLLYFVRIYMVLVQQDDFKCCYFYIGLLILILS
jgi:hypothetical protein